MAQNDVFKRYLDAGAAFTQLTQKRAEVIVKDFVKAGEIQTEQASQAVQDLLDRSRKTTEALIAQVRGEVRSQVRGLPFATKADINRLDRRIDTVASKATSSTAAAKPAAKKAPAKKSAASKAPAKKASVTKKAPAKKAATTKSPTRKAATSKSTAARATNS